MDFENTGFILTIWNININRLIVDDLLLEGFILTIWNINDRYGRYICPFHRGFILTIWNINLENYPGLDLVPAGFILTIWNINENLRILTANYFKVLY